MEKKISRRTFLKRILQLLGSLLIPSTGYYYAKYIEPHRLDITHHSISHPLIPSSFYGKRIVQFSDVHIGHNYDIEDLQKLIKKINELSPDIVLFTGDLFDNPNTYTDTDMLAQELTTIKAPLGKFAIYGNHDHGGYGTDKYRRVMKKAQFTLLRNQHDVIQLPDKSMIAIVGVDDMILGRPDMNQAFIEVPSNLYTILMLHEPDGADEASNFSAHLQLSGHSHGGQVKLPIYGAVVAPPLGQKYMEGFYDVDGMTLYVNRGLGTTQLPFRFLCVPELTVFTLEKKR